MRNSFSRLKIVLTGMVLSFLISCAANETKGEPASCSSSYLVIKNIAEFGENMPVEATNVTVYNNYSDMLQYAIPSLAFQQSSDHFELCQNSGCENYGYFFVSFERPRQYESPETIIVTMAERVHVECGVNYRLYLLAEDFFLEEDGSL